MKNRSFTSPKPGNRLDLKFGWSPAVLNGSYAAEQLSAGNRRIVVAEPVTARDERGLLVDTSAGHNPVSEEPSLSRIQHDFATGNLGNVSALNGNQTAGKNGRHHACPKYSNANSPESANDILRESACALIS